MSADISTGPDRLTPYVLLADDDPEIINVFAAYCRARGWLYDTAATAREAIDMVNAHCGVEGQRGYDLIIMDINFRDRSPDPSPRLTGISAAREIQRAYGQVPVIFYTAWDNSLVREQALPYAADFIVKTKPGQASGDGDIESVMRRAAHWINFWRASRYEGPERRRGASITSPELNQGRRVTDQQRLAKVPDPLDKILTQLQRKAAS